MQNELLVTGIITGVIAPILTQLARRWQWAEDLSRAVCVGIGGLIGLVAWLVSGMGADVANFLMMGLAAGGTATAAVNGWKYSTQTSKKVEGDPKPRSKDALAELEELRRELKK
jgi:hypothetical protein